MKGKRFVYIFVSICKKYICSSEVSTCVSMPIFVGKYLNK